MSLKSLPIIFICALLVSGCDKQQSTSPPPPAPPQVAALPADKYQASLSDGINFARPGYPTFIAKVEGMSALEPTGRWTDGSTVIFTFAQPLLGNLSVEIAGIPYGPNAGKPFRVTLGEQTREIVFATASKDFETKSASFAVSKPATFLRIDIPAPTVPPGGDRHLGIFLGSIKIK